MNRRKRLYVDYRGVIIFRNTMPGARLRWSCARGLASDTLAGIKAMIREARP